MIGLHTQRGMLILTLACMPFAVILSQAEPMLLLLQQPHGPSHYAGIWCQIGLLGIRPYFMFEALRRYLQNQQVLWPVLSAISISACINVLCNALLVSIFKLGLAGAALSTALSNWTAFLSLVTLAYIRHKYVNYKFRQLHPLPNVTLQPTSDNTVNHGNDTQSHEHVGRPLAGIPQVPSLTELASLRDDDNELYDDHIDINTNNNNNNYNNSSMKTLHSQDDLSTIRNIDSGSDSDNDISSQGSLSH